jgi:hypothetical protein
MRPVPEQTEPSRATDRNADFQSVVSQNSILRDVNSRTTRTDFRLARRESVLPDTAFVPLSPRSLIDIARIHPHH